MVRHARIALIASAFLAVAPGHAGDADPVVVTVGASSLRASDVSRRLAAVPSFQRTLFGKSDAEIRQRFVESVLVPELLSENAARERKLATAPWVRTRIDDALRRALADDVRAAALAKKPITAEEIAKHYEEHREQWNTGERIQIWRIVVGDEALARKIIEQARGVGGPDRWSALAREHSLDAATRFRGGSLGFVHADGRTDVPQLRVDPALFQAASAVADGTVVADPVREGDKFAVVWRRGTLPAISRTLADEQDAIRQVLERRRVQEAMEALLGRLRAGHATELHPDVLESLPTAATAAGPASTPEPAETARPAGTSAPPAAPSADPVPRPQPGGPR